MMPNSAGSVVMSSYAVYLNDKPPKLMSMISPYTESRAITPPFTGNLRHRRLSLWLPMPNPPIFFQDTPCPVARSCTHHIIRIRPQSGQTQVGPLLIPHIFSLKQSSQI